MLKQHYVWEVTIKYSATCEDAMPSECEHPTQVLYYNLPSKLNKFRNMLCSAGYNDTYKSDTMELWVRTYKDGEWMRVDMRRITCNPESSANLPISMYI